VIAIGLLVRIHGIIIAKRLLYFILTTFLPPNGGTEKFGILYHSAYGIMV
jgi:hypothetical protein